MIFGSDSDLETFCANEVAQPQTGTANANAANTNNTPFTFNIELSPFRV
jgi:hypothetical protein